MIDLKKNTLLREIPNNLLVDTKVTNLAKALQGSLDKMLDWVDKINYTTKLENLDDAILDHLLWEKHITYKEGLNLANTREQKINLINAAIDLHRHKGTPYAIEQVLEALQIKGEVVEWWKYNADPYHFLVELEVSRRIGNLYDAELLVLEYKNVRSWFDGFVMVLGSKDILLINDSYEYPVFYPYEPYGEKRFVLLDSEFVRVVNDSYDYVIDYPVSIKKSDLVNGENTIVLNDTYNYYKAFPETNVLETLYKRVSLQTSETVTKTEQYNYPVQFEISQKQAGFVSGEAINLVDNAYTYRKRFIETGNLFPLDKTVSTQISSISHGQDAYDFYISHPVCGEFVAGGE